MRKIQLVLLENDDNDRRDVRDGLHDFFGRMGFQAAITEVTNINDAIAMISKGAEVFVSDLRFGKEPAVGLDFIAQVKRDYPEVLTVACSGSYTWRIDVVGYGETKNWGGIAYSFAFGQQVKYQSLTDVLTEGNEKRFQETLGRMFGDHGNIWYHQNYADRVPRLSQHYMNKYFAPGYRRTACQAELESTLSQLAIVLGDSNEIKISGKAYTAPERALFSSFRLGGTTTICHGDLNSNNVIVPLRERG